ncbi:drug resistance protein YOR378W [Colletotrichum spaethianum]|uniref:Drug resistance protein YOR378W n=1 Tax=Colletotrichum spaethianum TaxID=700344 RepID=A0AA37PA46_9PEZI|nr:drug resistance protein YOR378W [Colletotrichum spaethianum]GKT48424.1 drug resistance protein YOR378W [Colletotrichum spaethianum]
MAPALDISKSFTDVAIGQHSWFTAAYAVTVGVFVLPLARLGETFGRKPIIVLGCLWFALWSLLAGFSLNVQGGGNNGTIYFCICRAMQGIGPALCVPNGFSILERTLAPGQKKDTAFSFFSATAPVGFVIGAVMSSLFAFYTVWEWSFFVLAAVCVSAAGLSVLVLPYQAPRETDSANSIWVQLDVSGTLLGGSGLILFSFACNQAPAVDWHTPYTYFLLIIGALFLAAFVYNETVAVNPLLPLSAMGSSTNLILGCTAAAWGCFIIWAFYTFQLSELLRDWTPLLTSAGFVPVAVESLAVALLLAYLVPGAEVYWAFLVSILSFPLASILMATTPPEQTYWANTFVSSLLAPLGMVMTGPLATILLQENLPENYHETASSLVLAVSNCAMSLSMGLARTVEVQVKQGDSNVLSGLRGAQYFGIGLGA